MSNIIWMVLTAVLLVSCYETERNCAQFKTGTFRFEAVIGTQIETTTFVRNDSMEIDYFRGNADTSSIRWINDCEYIVQKINPKNRAEKKAVHMKILSTQGNEYTFEYNIVGAQQKQRGTATKVQ
ncbi:MAG: DNA topoisomerase IV [Alteromonas sp.]|nr:DNA topoisomerase IV [Alteromonas sp.]MAY22158.1 DNA topoisomerase IV [Flavobacteriaceae bacterium]